MAKVAICMGSESDWSVMKDAASALEQFGVEFESHVLSAHRTPHEMFKFAEAASKKGIRVLIAGAGGAAHLPGMMASLTHMPVIGVPVPIAPMQGLDSLLSIVQMPKGVPVATVAIGNAFNAGLLAVQILSCSDQEAHLAYAMIEYRQRLREKVKSQKLPRSGSLKKNKKVKTKNKSRK